MTRITSLHLLAADPSCGGTLCSQLQGTRVAVPIFVLSRSSKPASLHRSTSAITKSCHSRYCLGDPLIQSP